MKMLPDNEVIELSGIKIPLDENVFSSKIITAIRSGQYEKTEAQGLPDINEQGDRILEIGAGIGYISALVARDPRVAAIRILSIWKV